MSRGAGAATGTPFQAYPFKLLDRRSQTRLLRLVASCSRHESTGTDLQFACDLRHAPEYNNAGLAAGVFTHGFRSGGFEPAGGGGALTGDGTSVDGPLPGAMVIFSPGLPSSG